jgi:hypothetical protein
MLESVPTILDPITLNNAGKSSYKIGNIKSLFNQAYDQLNEIRMQYENNMLKSNENIVYSLLLKK